MPIQLTPLAAFGRGYHARGIRFGPSVVEAIPDEYIIDDCAVSHIRSRLCCGPVALVWGWIRCVQDRWQLLTFFSVISLCGLLLASASALWGLLVIFYAYAGGFGTLPEHYAPNYGLFYRCVRYGAIVSLLASCLHLGASVGKG